MDLISKLTKNMGNNNEFLKPLVYNYRAYGWICLGKHEKALEDLNYI